MREHGLYGFIRCFWIGGFRCRAAGVLSMNGGSAHRQRDPEGEDSPQPDAEDHGQNAFSSVQWPGDRLFDLHLLSPSTVRLTHRQHDYFVRRLSQVKTGSLPPAIPKSHTSVL